MPSPGELGMSAIRLGFGLLLLLALLVPTAFDAAGQPRPRITHPRAVSLEPAGPAAAQSGRICVAAFEDRDGDGARGPGEAPRVGRSFLILDAANLTVARGATDASGEYCSSGLAPGAYAVREAGAAGAARTVTVAGADTVRAAFGGR